MKIARAILNTDRFALLVVLLVAAGCEEKAPFGVVVEYATPAWAGQKGDFFVKSETLGGDVLLMRRSGVVFDLGYLTGKKPIEQSPESNEIIYRYDPDNSSTELEQVDVRAWTEATGYESSAFQQFDRVPRKLQSQIYSIGLRYSRHDVPTKGNYVATISGSSCDRRFIEILSGVREPRAMLDTRGRRSVKLK